MRIVGALWTPRVNYICIACPCGRETEERADILFDVRADRWWITCPRCKRRENMATLRDRYVEESS